MLACARIGAVHSVVFGGFAANELATRIEDATAEGRRLRLVRHRAGADRRVQAAARRGDRAGRVEARALHRPPATGARGRARPARDSRVARRPLAGRRAGRLRPARCHRPALHHLHLGDDRAAEGDRPRQRRPRGRARVVDEEHLRRRAGRGVLGGLGHRLDRGPLLHRLRPAAARLHDRPLRGQAGRDAGRGRVLARHRPSTASARSSPRRPRSARSASRIPTASTSAATTSRGFRALFLAGERCDPRRSAGREEKLGIAGDRPLVADRDGLAGRRQLHRDRAAAGRPRLADAGRARLGPQGARRGGAERPPGEIGALVVKLPMPPGSSPTLWNADERYRETYLDLVPRLLPDRRRRLRRRGRATSS